MSNSRSSSIPAVSTGSENREDEVGTSASLVTLTLSTSEETIELSRVTEACWERAADCAAVVAEEVITTAGDGVCVTLVLKGRDGGWSDYEDASDSGDLGESGDHFVNVRRVRGSGTSTLVGTGAETHQSKRIDFIYLENIP